MPRTPALLTPAFGQATVGDAMRAGIISCPADAPVRAIAEIMASYHVHAVVVEGVSPGAGLSWGIVTDAGLTNAAARGELDRTAGDLAAPQTATIGPSDSLTRAARLMSEHGVSHLIVSVEPTTRPLGVLSTLDLAVVLAWGRDAG
jgi:CBS domain-containing protein